MDLAGQSGLEDGRPAPQANGAVLGSLLGHGEDKLFGNTFLLLVSERLKGGHPMLGHGLECHPRNT